MGLLVLKTFITSHKSRFIILVMISATDMLRGKVLMLNLL